MSPNYKLTYFNVRGFAEFSRLIMAQAGVDYEDVRLERENWPAIKPTTPFGQVPVFEVDGVTICQSRAIARFLAREHGLAGKNNLESAKCDMLVDAIFDIFTILGKWKFESDPVKKEELGKQFATETLPPFLDNLVKILKSNNEGKSYYVGDSLTWADISVAHTMWMLLDFIPGVLDKHASLNSFKEKILNLPNIKAWIDKRPKTEI